MSVNILDAKQKIIEFISERGPSLPVHLTKVVNMNLTFTSAILSELLKERRLKLSSLRVGASPLYLIPGQEERLESFISNLKEPEIDAFKKLRENRILDDEKQNPVTRVALRSIRDFAVPIKKGEKLFWKYHLLSDDKAMEALGEKDESFGVIGQERVLGQQIWEDIQKQQISKEKIEEIVKKQLEEVTRKLENSSIEKGLQDSQIISLEETEKKDFHEPKFNDIEINSSEVKNSPKKAAKIKKISKKDLFLEESKFLLEKRGLGELEIIKQDITKIIAVSSNPEILILFFNKKRVDETEILRDLRKFNLPGRNVKIFLRGDAPKKMVEKVHLLKLVEDISKIEEQ